jgi:hypothetical protein
MALHLNDAKLNISNMATWRNFEVRATLEIEIVQGIERWVVCTSKCERFRNTRLTATFGLPL